MDRTSGGPCRGGCSRTKSGQDRHPAFCVFEAHALPLFGSYDLASRTGKALKTAKRLGWYVDPVGLACGAYLEHPYIDYVGLLLESRNV